MPSATATTTSVHRKHLQRDKTWQPDYTTCDVDTVAIGYHNPRVDYLLGAGVTVDGNSTLTIMPGTVVAMFAENYASLIINGKLMCEGNPFEEGYVRFVKSPLASARWLEDRPSRTNGSSSPLIYLTSNSSGGSRINFTEFGALRYGLLASCQFDANTVMLHDNILKWNYKGMAFGHSGITVFNSLFVGE